MAAVDVEIAFSADADAGQPSTISRDWDGSYVEPLSPAQQRVTLKCSQCDTSPCSVNLLTELRQCQLGDTPVVSFAVTIKDLPLPLAGDNLLSALSTLVARPSNHAADETGQSLPVTVITLGRSLRTGFSFDLRFIAFSRRSATKKLAAPLAIYASSAVLQAISPKLAFNDTNGARQDRLTVDLSDHFNGGGALLAEALDDYDYDSDSDFDEDEVVAKDCVGLLGAAQEGFAHSPEPSIWSPPQGVIEEVQKGGDQASQSSKTPRDRENKASISHNDYDESLGEMAVDSSELAPSSSGRSDQPLGSVNVGRTIVVKGALHKTWHALIYYCYTGNVIFSPLKSQGSPRTTVPSDGPPPCSPKSMYRLADHFGIDALKDLAFAAISEGLSETNVLDEALSRFTSKFPIIQNMEIAMLLEHRGAPEVLNALPAKIEKAVRGEMPHSGQVLSALLAQLYQR
ncbi:hypothetical protein BV22DRAFT_1062764 [Leucogyrophana mollusca]|uniref:Uncharacterized protein n=1 Tax=Leucogyrophana mollusca TaxID=85980 RepID=A0ACB8BNT5_9AGAM|nr:hypothetical protein BV22DRAFT_1062764 [Leucogyrophana mollusca]